MRGKILGWSSSDLRLLSTKVGDDRSLSLISRTARDTSTRYRYSFVNAEHALRIGADELGGRMMSDGIWFPGGSRERHPHPNLSTGPTALYET